MLLGVTWVIRGEINDPTKVGVIPGMGGQVGNWVIVAVGSMVMVEVDVAGMGRGVMVAVGKTNKVGKGTGGKGFMGL